MDWQSASVRPLWRCARTPYWVLPSLAGDNDAHKQCLRSVFHVAVTSDPVFARAVDADDTCHALDEVVEYNAFCDGFLMLLTLQSMCVSSFLRSILFFFPSLLSSYADWPRFWVRRTSTTCAISSIRRCSLVAPRACRSPPRLLSPLTPHCPLIVQSHPMHVTNPPVANTFSCM